MGTPVDLDKLRSIGYIGRRTRPVVREWKTDDGERHKATRDELNNTVTQHARGDRQDVHVRVQDTPSLHISDIKEASRART